MNPLLDVRIVESGPRPLAKVAISGGGRCNVTHACFDVDRLVEAYPRGGRLLRPLFRRFGPRETVAWFEKLGVRLKTEPDGRMFPVTDDAQTVVNALLKRAERLGVRLETKTPVKRIVPSPRGFDIDGVPAGKVVLATGGSRSGFALAQGLGHDMVAPVPSLFTFEVNDPRLTGLAGVALPHARGRLEGTQIDVPAQEGPLLITHWGLSGPVVLRLSAWGARALHACGYRARLRLDMLASMSFDEVRGMLLERKARGDRKHAGNDVPLPLPRRLWTRLLEACDIAPDRAWCEVPGKGLNRLAEMVKNGEFEISGKGVFKEEFVTAGGVALSELDLQTMQSRRVPGLYCVGELIDVDALTGGFNFQNAWTTGFLAGEAAARQ